MRSAGYFFKSRSDIEDTILDSALFLTEEQTTEYFAKCVENTELVGRQTNTENPEHDTNTPTNGEDRYPWLDSEDPTKYMTGTDIIKKSVDLSESCLSDKEKENVYLTLIKYKDVFSLRNEIGQCPNTEVELELNDKTPFFIRPFPIKESDKTLVDMEMKRGCLLGILKKGISSHSSPIMLIPRKLGGIPRIVTDFRHLNSRLVKSNASIPLVRNAIQILGASEAEVLSLADLKDVYHTLSLVKKSQQYCGITLYSGPSTCIYQRLGMGLSVSPAILQNFINRMLDEIPDRNIN